MKGKSLIKVSAVILLALIGLCLIFFVSQFLLHQDKSPSGTVLDFGLALIENDEKQLRAHGVSEQQERITMWLNDHEPYHCPFSLDLDDTKTLITREYDENHQVTGYGYYHMCRSGERPFVFTIENVTVSQVEGSWVVTDWGHICESREYGGC